MCATAMHLAYLLVAALAGRRAPARAAPRMGAVLRSAPHVVICPGFGNDQIDYVAPLGQPEEEGLCAALQRRGYASTVVPVERRDWLRVASGLLDVDFLRGRGTPEGRAFRWYIERVRRTVAEARADADRPVIVLGHSAGGWLARVALSDAEAWGVPDPEWGVHEAVQALVTLGTPHHPPPPDVQDQTQGVLRDVHSRFPGAHVPELAYVTVASDAIVGDPSAPRGTAERVAAGSYYGVCGDATAAGDGVVPRHSAHLSGALQLDMESTFHSINEPGSARPTRQWYGSEARLDGWLAPVERHLSIRRNSLSVSFASAPIELEVEAAARARSRTIQSDEEMGL